jgi:hypothetical protein
MTDFNQGAQTTELKINISEALQSGKFSNVAQINATDLEVTFDFAYVAPNSPNEGVLVSRIVLSPKHAESFKNAFIDVLDKHYGENK